MAEGMGKMGSSDDLKAEALEQLGEELVGQNWKPSQTTFENFGIPNKNDPIGLRKLALSYLIEKEPQIREIICRDSSVKIEITSVGSATSAVADALLASGGFIVPVTSLANVLCVLGLSKFCENGPRGPAISSLGDKRP